MSLPDAGVYEIDPAHSDVSFTVRHLGLSKVRGRFESFEGVLTITDDLAASHATVTIDAASFTTGAEDRDGHVKSPDFLDVETYPHLTFRSTGVRSVGEEFLLDGELTIRDVTKPVTLDVTFEGEGQDPWGGTRIAFVATTEVEREDFGVSFNQVLESGGVLIGKTVKIAIEVQAVQKVEAAA